MQVYTAPRPYFPLWELLLRYGVPPEQARSLAIGRLQHWSVEDVERIFAKVLRPSAEFCLFKSNAVQPTNLPIREDDLTAFQKWWPSLWDVAPCGVSAPRKMVEESAATGAVLCVNVRGEWSLRREGYVALSHVWIEGLQREEKYGGLERRKIVKVFELLRRAGLQSEWIWTDVLVIPGGWPTAPIEDELLTVSLINSMPAVYGQAEAVLIFDALALQLHSTDPLEVAVALACGKWATRVWTFQEIKLANTALVVTATGSVNFADMISHLKALHLADESRYRKLYHWLGIMAKSNAYRLTIRDLVEACGDRKSGVDIDYARAFFPSLGLTWTNGMTREEGMQMIYRAMKDDTIVIAAFAGSRRMKLQPAWAPSYLTGLEGVGSDTPRLEWEDRGIRGKWYLLKINTFVSATRPRYGKIGLNLEVNCDLEPKLQIVTSPNEEPEVVDAVKTMIARGVGYILSIKTFATYSEQWARSVLIVERAETLPHHDMEVAVHCAATIGSPGAHREEFTNLLVRHGNPNVDGDFYNQYCYDAFCKSEASRLPDMEPEEGETPLHVAVRTGDIKAVKSYVDEERLSEAYDVRGYTPLHVAAARGAVEALEIIARKAKNISIPARDISKDTPLTLVAGQEVDQAESRKILLAESVRVLLDEGANIEEQNGYGYTALMSAAYECNEAVVSLLLSRGADPESSISKIDGTPMTLASGRVGGVKVMETLATYGANVNAQPQLVGWTPLLKLGYETNLGPTYGWTPLLKATEFAGEAEVEFLLRRGAHPNVQDSRMRTPLGNAIQQAHEQGVRLLLDAGADRATICEDGLSPVHLAATCGNYKIMQMLLDGGHGRIDANVRASEKDQKNTALHMAVQKQQGTVVKLLLSQGADVNAVNMEDKTALDVAVELGDKGLEAILKKSGGHQYKDVD
ncbi:hypothetical protein DSL72_002547 [Monilinia vaccinii-corymbosi]|uniref:Heterokaryon incompatibility domain-containing protein n=1 Tax=Monilinia vaccinii-corymbosi TaxID=61207 RepID=A0A8A3PCZ2_9HELO|nr:hypothetical protein DSL72_002547 [Monilinia vaccinii-corymbosi]